MIVTDEGSRVDFYFYELPLKPAQGPQLEVPVHDSCAKGIRNAFFRQAATVVLAALVVGAIGVYGRFPGIALTVAFAFFATFFVQQALRRMPFEFQLARTGYVLMFNDRAYAERVASLNGAQVRIGRDPYTGN